MKIKKNLVWDNYSGELVGFVDLVDVIDYATVLQLLPLIELQHFELCLFWQAVIYSEGMNLKVIAATADEPSKKIKDFLECINIFVVIQMLM